MPTREASRPDRGYQHKSSLKMEMERFSELSCLQVHPEGYLGS